MLKLVMQRQLPLELSASAKRGFDTTIPVEIGEETFMSNAANTIYSQHELVQYAIVIPTIKSPVLPNPSQC